MGAQATARTTTASFIGNLPELLLGMMSKGRAMVAIASFPDERYVQFWVEDGTIEAEVISNENVPQRNALTEAQEEMLVEAGWTPPGEESPNFQMVAEGPQATLAISRAVADAIQRILGKGGPFGDELVTIRQFEAHRRGRVVESAQG